MKKALVVVDYQLDHCEKGKLPFDGALAIQPNVERHLRDGNYDFRVCTRQWHPANHVSFASAWNNREPGEVEWTPFGKQKLFPSHCVAGTLGAELAIVDAAALGRINLIANYGMDKGMDPSSVFAVGNGLPSDFFFMFEALDFDEVDVCGLNVKSTVLDLYNFFEIEKINILKDATICTEGPLENILWNEGISII